MGQPDMLLFMGDRHSAGCCSWGTVNVDTPSLDRLRRDGVCFEQAYTSCPLGGPARMSMLTGLLPAKTGIFSDYTALSDTIPCFTHVLVDAGYETVLAGSMHFIGTDQSHGFIRRLGAGEILEYLKQAHKKPQFIVVCMPEKFTEGDEEKRRYRKYLHRMEKPAFFDMDALPDYMSGFTILNRRIEPEKVIWEKAKSRLAAYYSQIEYMDARLGEVRAAFESYCARSHRDGVFGYLAGHGDMAGERRLFGSAAFFDKAVRIPLLFAGYGIMPGKKVKDLVSILDVGPTVCSLAGTRFEIGDGSNLEGYLGGREEIEKDRMVISQFVDQMEGREYGGIMLRYRQYKYILYHGFEDHALLFDLKKDPEEKRNLAEEAVRMAAWFKERTGEYTGFYEMEELYREKERNTRWFKAFEAAASGR